MQPVMTFLLHKLLWIPILCKIVKHDDLQVCSMSMSCQFRNLVTGEVLRPYLNSRLEKFQAPHILIFDFVVIALGLSSCAAKQKALSLNLASIMNSLGNRQRNPDWQRNPDNPIRQTDVPDLYPAQVQRLLLYYPGMGRLVPYSIVRLEQPL